MTVEGPISHRYEGEPDLTERAGLAGAHFSLIEENIAIGASPATIHQGWLDSPDHRANLLNSDADRMGIAVVASQGLLFAVADYAHAVPVLTPSQVENAIAGLLRAKGLVIIGGTTDARAYCAYSGKPPETHSAMYRVRWQGPDMTKLPQPLIDRLATGHGHKAAIGSCPPQDVDRGFTVYRVAVLLYAD